MHKVLILLGAAAIALGVTSHGAEARKRTYDINGQRYTYDTNNPEQVALARKRIEAANAADAARTKAEAEKAATPLVSVFGSPTQKEAADAQARLQQALSEPDPAAEAAKQASDARSEARAKRAEDPQKETAAAEKEQAETQRPSQTARATVAAVPVEQTNALNLRRKKVKSISFDVESGIKTTILVDGSVEEEPFDSSMLSHLLSEPGASKSLAAFVNQLRKSSPEEATGTLPMKRLRPETASASAMP